MSKFKVDITGINTSNLKVLSHEENMILFKRLRNGEKEVKDEIIMGNLKLVLSILKSFNHKNVNMDDLFEVGVIGLIKAIDNFDITYNLKLSTYAVPLILGEIKKYLRDDTLIRVSRSVKDDAYRILKYKEYYLNKYGKDPLISDIEKETGLSEYEISYALESLNEVKSLSEPIYNDGGDTIYLEDQISENKKEFDKDIIISLNKGIKTLSLKEQRILNERYIIGKTQSEIADMENISQAQISRIEKKALSKLRRFII